MTEDKVCRPSLSSSHTMTNGFETDSLLEQIYLPVGGLRKLWGKFWPQGKSRVDD